MPELPEIETIKQGLLPYLTNQVIDYLIVRHSTLRFPLSPTILAQSNNQRISTIIRRGKYLLFVLDKGYLLIHLGMSGHLKIVNPTDTPGKHDHIDLVLKNKLVLRYNDPRRFGAWLYFTEDFNTHSLFTALGPEPLTEQFNSTYLYKKTNNKSLAVKSFIMDNKIVVGVGNIYATESLFRAKIHPQSKTGLLTFEQVDELVQAIKEVLKQAIKAGGTTLQDFCDIEGKPGYFVNQLLMYGRYNKPCFTCKQLIQITTIGGRSSTFCPNCQPLNV